MCEGPELSAEMEEDVDTDEFEVDVDEVDEDNVDERNDGVDGGKKDGQQKRYLFRGLIYFIMCQQFGLRILVGSWNHVLHGGTDPPMGRGSCEWRRGGQL